MGTCYHSINRTSNRDGKQREKIIRIGWSGVNPGTPLRSGFSSGALREDELEVAGEKRKALRTLETCAHESL